jgi:hypothetical protein
MISEGKVGIQNVAKGVQAVQSLGGMGELLVSELLPRYAALALTGRVFHAISHALTVTATTDISPLPANTGRPLICLGNPTNSVKAFVVLAHGVATISGTPGGPILFNSLANVNNITAAANVTPINALVGGPTTSAAKVWGATAITGSSAGVLRGVAASIAAVAATGNNGNTWTGNDLTDGLHIVLPGNGLLMAAYAVGTSHVASAWVAWAEIDANFISLS